MLKLKDIHFRDPFVLPMPEEGLYYLYGTTGAAAWEGPGPGFDVYTGRDLENWEGPQACFRPPPGFWADRNFWAPEVHCYQGQYYMFASFKSAEAVRATQILVSPAPCGPFLPLSDRPATPPEWECLDGTLYVDPEGCPWLVFCHEWVQVQDGEICALPLTRDLRQPAGAPTQLFRASQAPWVKPYPRPDTWVTDGPFLYQAANGELLMLWASFTGAGYAQGVARSPSGRILGPWQHDPQPLYSQDGGHGMLFRTFEGRLTLSLHAPNASPSERPLFLPLEEREGSLSLL
jgi:arabinan endo-1,5-alpha-L-arabinosidase